MASPRLPYPSLLPVQSFSTFGNVRNNGVTSQRDGYNILERIRVGLEISCVSRFSSGLCSPFCNTTTARRKTLYNYSPYGDVPRERDTFFTPSVYERVGISLVEVY